MFVCFFFGGGLCLSDSLMGSKSSQHLVHSMAFSFHMTFSMGMFLKKKDTSSILGCVF